jgi:hypothetical protein
MEFETHSHRNGLELAENNADYKALYESLTQAIRSITDDELIDHFRANYEGKQKSISKSINALLREKLGADGWEKEPRIFGEPGYSDTKRDKKWRLDFAKSVRPDNELALESNLEPTPGIAVEVAFNNNGSTAWNLTKPLLASELNHVKKDIQTGLGVIVTATEKLKSEGGFDTAVGTFDDFKMHLRAMRNILVVPIIILGLHPFDDFRIKVRKVGNKQRGFIDLKSDPKSDGVTFTEG